MSCRQTIELLPWYLNRSLSLPEREAVESHLAECAACREELVATRQTGVWFGTHPAIAALSGWVAEGRPDGELARHVEVCPDCREEVALLETSRELVEADNVVPMPHRPGTASRARWPAAAAVAASLLVVAASVWAMLSAQRQLERLGAERSRLAAEARDSALSAASAEARVEALEQRVQAADARLADAEATLQAPPRVPRVGHPVLDLLPEEMVVRAPGDPDAGPVEIPGEADWVTVLLVAPRAAPGVGHRLELRDAAGELLWSADQVRKDLAAGGFPVLIPVELLRGRGARLRLFAAGENEPLATYRLPLAPAP